MRSLPGRNRNRYTAAVSNKRIKENLVKVDAEFAEDIHIRIPVIPTVNMNENNMKDTIKFLSNLKHIKDIELLPYHRLGLETYERLERVYELKDVEIPDMEMLKKMAEVIRAEDPEAAVKVKGEEILFLLFILYSPDLRIYVMIFSDDNKEERMNETGSIFSGNRLSL